MKKILFVVTGHEEKGSWDESTKEEFDEQKVVMDEDISNFEFSAT